MKETTFQWYLKKQMKAATMSGTLDLRVLGRLAERDAHLRALFLLYATANLDENKTTKHLAPSMAVDYGRHYIPSGKPTHAELNAMPDEYRTVYGAYQAYLNERKTRFRVKILCRRRIQSLMREQSLSLRDVGRRCGIGIGCFSRFLNGCDYAISSERLIQIIATLGGDTNVEDI